MSRWVVSLEAAATLAALAALGGAGVGYGLGGRVASAQAEADLAALQLTHELQASQAADAQLARLTAASARGDALAARLAAAQAAQHTQAQEYAREIKRLTTGRPCLNAGTVRLLNDAPAQAGAVSLSAPAGLSAAEAAAAASDTDVAGWIDGAQRQYDVCRRRLDALIDWHQESPDGHL